MVKNLPLFPVSLVGSWPRKKEILDLILQINEPGFDQKKLDEVSRNEVAKLIMHHEALGVNVMSDGELNRDNYVSYVSQRFGGIKLMDALELSDYLENSCEFVEKLLSQANAPIGAIKNAICIGKLEYREGLTLEDVKFMKEQTSLPLKVSLPGPYLLARSMWLPKAAGHVYESKEAMAEDILKLLKQEVENLQKLGVDVIQIDEPVLTEIVFTKHTDDDASFMCSVLSKKKTPEEELAFASYLIKSLMDHIDSTKSIAALHTCRGNWGKEDSTMLTGSYTPLVKLFEEVNADMLTLEFSTPRAGGLEDLFVSEKLREKIVLGLGVLNPRNDIIETVESIVNRAEEALQWVPKERLWLTSDCGFGTFSNSPISTYEIGNEKIRVAVEAAKILREKYNI